MSFNICYSAVGDSRSLVQNTKNKDHRLRMTSKKIGFSSILGGW